MPLIRKYNNKPYRIVLVHGGPGAPESITPLAKELSKNFSILEPIQTKASIRAQVEELYEAIKYFANYPVILAGWSWGAWLAYIFTSYHNSFVKKLILISAPAFEEKGANKMAKTRLKRLSQHQKDRLKYLETLLGDSKSKNKDKIFARFGQLFEKSDSFNKLSESCVQKAEFDIYKKVWKEALDLRKRGKLAKLGENIKILVYVIHGDYDPTPYKSVIGPISKVIPDTKLFIIKKCGHAPWDEKHGKDEFFNIFNRIIK